MPDPIRPLRSYTTNYRPTSAEVAEGELVINWADGIIFTKNTASNIVAWQFGVSAATASGTTSTTSTLAAIATSGSASDLGTGTLPALRLPATTVTAGTYGSASAVPVYTVDSTGRLTSATSTAIAISAGAVSGLASVATSGSAADLTGTLADARLSTNIATASAVSAAQAYAIQRDNHTGVQAIGTVSGLQAALDGKQAAGSYATLDGNGKVSASQLPSYVDDVLEYASLSAFPVTGETGKIYTALDSNKIYRWSGSTYIEISPSPGSTDSVAEGTTNLYYTNARASAAAPVQQVAGRTGNVTLWASDISGLGSLATQSSVAYSSLTGAPALAAVATSGSASDLTGTLASSRLPTSGVTAATYGSASTVPVVAVDAAGRVTSATSTAIAISAGAVSGLATVATSGSYNDLTNSPTIPAAYTLPVATNTVLGGVKQGANTTIAADGTISVAAPVTSLPYSSITGTPALATIATSGSATDLTGTLSASRLPATTVTAGSYGSASSVATYTVDAAGRLTAAGSTAIAISAGAVSGLATVATSGSYADLTDRPSIPSAYTLPSATISTLGGVIVGTGLGVSSGIVSVTYGTTIGTACQGNDSRLSDARTPVSHASSHSSGGADAVSLAASQITSGTIATARLGSGTASASTFLRGDQTYATIAASNVSGLAASATTDTTVATNISSGTLSASRLPASGVTAGTYTSVTVDTTGRVTAGSNPSSSGGVKLGLVLALQ